MGDVITISDGFWVITLGDPCSGFEMYAQVSSSEKSIRFLVEYHNRSLGLE